MGAKKKAGTKRKSPTTPKRRPTSFRFEVVRLGEFLHLHRYGQEKAIVADHWASDALAKVLLRDGFYVVSFRPWKGQGWWVAPSQLGGYSLGHGTHTGAYFCSEGWRLARLPKLITKKSVHIRRVTK